MCNKDFLRQILSGEKKLLKISEVKFVNIPRFDELSVKNLYPRFKNDKLFMQHMPSKFAKGRLPDRAYFFNLLNTIHGDRVQEMVAYANKARFQGGSTGIDEETVLVTSQWWQDLNSMPYFSQ